jgi:hypothetical protein
MASKNPKTKKKPTTTKKTVTTPKAIDKSVILKEKKKKEPLGKAFYLVFAIVFYTAAFFYINNILYNNNDLVQSALFAFAALFVVFVLLLFNIHLIIFHFFYLPLERMFKQARQEAKKEIVFSTGKNKMQTVFNKYKTIFTIVLYVLISGVLIYSSITRGLDNNEKILRIVTSALLSELLFLVIVCSWQYLFHIIPSILDKSIDAQNGFILTLSAAVMGIYILFQVFEIVYLAELMIFVLIIGFVALLGVNLNMIVGEINIFQNLRTKQSKTVTKIVFLVFFAFHIYVILYASVVAYSIYLWDNDSYHFSYQEYEEVIIPEVYNNSGNRITEVYDSLGNVIDTVYDVNGNIIQDFYDTTTTYYNVDGFAITDYYDESGFLIQSVFDENGQQLSNYFYYDGSLATSSQVPVQYTYGAFLYYTVVTVSTLGYGDITPSTSYNIALGWGGFLSMYGLTFFALSIGFVSNIAMEGIITDKK